MQRTRTRLTRHMRRSLEDRLVDLDARIHSLAEQSDGDESPDATALLLQMSRERQQIAEALAGARLIDDDPFDTEATELGDTITIRETGSETAERYVLVDGAVGSRASSDWVSVTSPLGAALLGRGKGDEVVVQTPAGSTRYVILGFERASDAIGNLNTSGLPRPEAGPEFPSA